MLCFKHIFVVKSAIIILIDLTLKEGCVLCTHYITYVISKPTSHAGYDISN